MKQWIGSFVLVCACLPLAAGEAGQKRRVKEAAQAMAAAFLKEDYEKFADYMPAALVKLAGGREKLVAKIKDSMAQMKDRGIKLLSYTVDDPTGLSGMGDERFAVLPYTMVMTLPGAKVTMKAPLIASSEDGGKRWKFIDAQKKSAEEIRKILPNFPADLKLPPPQEPVVEKLK
jgi:hypothetical protein